MMLLIAVATVVALWLRWRYKNRRLLSIARGIPGPPALPVLGNALRFMCQPEEFIAVIKEMTKDYGDIFRFWLGPDLNVVVSNPDELKGLLTNMKTSVKGPQYKYMRDVLGDGILSGSGPSWRKHRKLANPNYGKRAIQSYSSVFNHEVDLLLAQYRAETGLVDIYRHIVRTTSYSVCRTLMGLSKEQTMNLPHIQDIINDTPRLYDIVFDRMTKWYLQIDPVFWMTKFYKEQKVFLSKMLDFSKTILEHRMTYLKTLGEQNKIDLMQTEEDSFNNTQLSVIDRFILSQELDKEELNKETFTIFTSYFLNNYIIISFRILVLLLVWWYYKRYDDADDPYLWRSQSQEASAKIASFLLLMMAYHPDCQRKLYQEITEVIGEKDRPVTDEDLKRMPYLEMVFKEVLRLFPIGALIQRTIVEDVPMKSGILPAGCSLVVPIYHLHRDARFWTKPDAFDPERFSPENTRMRHPCCYIPFSLGPMDCLGRYFGTKLIKTICVRVLREFAVTSPRTYADLKLAIAISVVSVDGFHAELVPRRNGRH